MNLKKVSDILKFFTIEFGVHGRFDNRIGKFILKGNHNLEVLNKKLDEFIKHFVVCPKCNNPETQFVSSKKSSSKNVGRKCRTCGILSNQFGYPKIEAFIFKDLDKLSLKIHKSKKNYDMVL